jgi:2'-5' RNA ligase
LRQAHFPPERNYLRAHLTMFHHLPPSVEAELQARLKALAKTPAPDAQMTGLINMGRGVAFRIQSPALAEIRNQIADALQHCLTPQDQAAWRPHVTVQNKVKLEAARALLDQLSAGFKPRRIEIAGLCLWRYLDGPWDAVGAWRFGQGHAMLPPVSLGG